jgi:hypothetical protein
MGLRRRNDRMKKIEVCFVVISFFLVLCGYSFDQQDYQIVQNYKEKQQQIEVAIKNAKSLDDLNHIQTQADQLRSDFLKNKDLLDKSLYPENLNSSIAKLNSAIDLRRGDFTQISTLNVQVSQLQLQLDSLNVQNSDLLNQIQQIKETNSKDVAKLEKTIRELRGSLIKRDKIIISMLKDMLPGSNSGNDNLTDKEKQQIYSETKKANIIVNTKKAIDDNIKFLSVTTLTPEDLNSLKKQQSEFENVWHDAGPAIVSVYSAKKDNTSNAKEIDSAIVTWNNSIDQGAWTSIRQKLSDRGITLNTFSNGTEFVQSVSSYIDDKVKNAKVNSVDSQNLYKVFADSVWSRDIKPAWIPYLLSNKLLTSNDNEKIEAKIAEWKNAVTQNNYTWLYIILGVLAVIIIIVVLVRTSQSRKNKVSQSTV